MPVAPRVKGKGTRIAYKLMGVPPNMQSKRNKPQKKINQRLVFEETQRVR